MPAPRALHRFPSAGRDDEGFTLIELLVVVVIIGVLVSIAIPLYSGYRKGAENKSAQSDARNAVATVEVYFTENGNSYPVDITSSTAGAAVVFPALTGGSSETANVSPGNTLDYHRLSDGTYSIAVSNSDTGTTFTYTSKDGQLVKTG
jgi:type IV pilus assembly protein PilA